MTRKKQYATTAQKQRAYRKRKADSVLRLNQPNIRGAAETPALSLPGGSDGSGNRNAEHTEAVGLVVRIEAILDHNRVLATVLQPGTSRLLPGTAYPFRADWLRVV